MSTLYIDRKGIELRLDGGRILLYEDGERSASVPLTQLERVIVQQRARLDSRLLGALAENDVGLLFIDQRHPKRTAWLLGRPGNDLRRRAEQYRRGRDDGWRCYWSCVIVLHKIHAHRRFLLKARAERPDLRHPLTKAVGELAGMEHGLRDGLKQGGMDLEPIRGTEGAAAASFFRAYRHLFPDSLRFEGRNRRPPRDPVNACLSLGYTLLHAEAVMACHRSGLDPLQGFYHEPAFGRESLASDLIEPLRASVDEWVWELVRTRELRTHHFHRRGQACLLSKEGRQRFYPAWERLAPVMRRNLRAMTRRLARRLLDGAVMQEGVA